MATKTTPPLFAIRALHNRSGKVVNIASGLTEEQSEELLNLPSINTHDRHARLPDGNRINWKHFSLLKKVRE